MSYYVSIKDIDTMNFIKHTYYAYSKALPKKICEEIIDEGESKQLMFSSTFKEALKKNKKHYRSINSLKIRNSHNSWLQPFWIYKEIKPYIESSNRLGGWNFNYNVIENFQFTKYEGTQKQHYTWHSDNASSDEETKQVRKLSTIIMLSDPKNFKGGDLEFYEYGPPKMKNKILKTNNIKHQGTIITFPSFLIHRVLPVTKGVRYSLVVWHKGPPLR